MKKKFRSFEDARKFTHSLGLKSQKEWFDFSKSSKKPADIPTAVHSVYKKDWKSWGDWLGTGTVASYYIKFRPFNEARDFVQALKLQSQGKWFQFTKTGKLLSDIPVAPHSTYKKDWKSWGDWLGSGSVGPGLRKYRSFEEAKEYVISLNLVNNKEWRKYCSSGNKPENIPSNPNTVYKKEWKSWGDWLGTDALSFTEKKKLYLPFPEAKKFVHFLKIKNQQDWIQYKKSKDKPKNIPSSPEQTYKKEWRGLGDWLGTGTVANKDRKYRSFEESRKFVHSLELGGTEDWFKFTKSGKKPIDVPSNPNRVYKKEWKGWGDWTGTGFVATRLRKYRSFEEARKFVQSLKLKNQKNWLDYSKSDKKPDDIPANPEGVYKKDWKGLGDWLGSGTVATFQREYRSFEEARQFVHNLGLNGANAWRKFTKSKNMPDDIPAGPNRTYKDKGWKSWGDWLGTGIIATYNIKYREFNDAKKFIRSLGLKSVNEWREYSKSGKKPVDIPLNLSNTYKKEWTGWGNLLGTGQIAARDMFLEFKTWNEAKNIIRELAKKHNLRNRKDWEVFTKKNELPSGIPKYPWSAYSKKNILRRKKLEKEI